MHTLCICVFIKKSSIEASLSAAIRPLDGTNASLVKPKLYNISCLPAPSQWCFSVLLQTCPLPPVPVITRVLPLFTSASAGRITQRRSLQTLERKVRVEFTATVCVCLCRKKCGCFHHGEYLRAGLAVNKAVYVMPGDTSCGDVFCGENKECKLITLLEVATLKWEMFCYCIPTHHVW